MIYRVRYGETVWNVAGRQQGHLDSVLTDQRILQSPAASRALRQLLPGMRGVVVEASPLGRARQIATVLFSELGISPDDVVVTP